MTWMRFAEPTVFAPWLSAAQYCPHNPACGAQLVGGPRDSYVADCANRARHGMVSLDRLVARGG